MLIKASLLALALYFKEQIKKVFTFHSESLTIPQNNSLLSLESLEVHMVAEKHDQSRNRSEEIIQCPSQQCENELALWPTQI